MFPIKYYKYKCRKCHLCIHTYTEKDNCIKCGYPWKIKEQFTLNFPDDVRRNNDVLWVNK